MPIEKINELLTYVKTKVDNEECLVLTPSKAIEHYNKLYHNDVAKLL